MNDFFISGYLKIQMVRSSNKCRYNGDLLHLILLAMIIHLKGDRHGFIYICPGRCTNSWKKKWSCQSKKCETLLNIEEVILFRKNIWLRCDQSRLSLHSLIHLCDRHDTYVPKEICLNKILLAEIKTDLDK